MKRKIVSILIMLVSAATLFTGIVSAEEVSEEKDAIEKEADSWDSFSFQIGDQKYQFPMSYEDFTGYGWESEENLKDLDLEWHEFEAHTFYNGESMAIVSLINLDKETKFQTECYVGGMIVTGVLMKDAFSDIVLPKEIGMDSTVEDIKEAYGEPDEIFDGSSVVILNYQESIYNTLSIKVDKAKNSIYEIEIYRYTMPGEKESFENAWMTRDSREARHTAVEE